MAVIEIVKQIKKHIEKQFQQYKMAQLHQFQNNCV